MCVGKGVKELDKNWPQLGHWSEGLQTDTKEHWVRGTAGGLPSRQGHNFPPSQQPL